MTSSKNADKFVVDILTKDETYPCQRCFRWTAGDVIVCGDKNCPKWRCWFDQKWKAFQEGNKR